MDAAGEKERTQVNKLLWDEKKEGGSLMRALDERLRAQAG